MFRVSTSYCRYRLNRPKYCSSRFNLTFPRSVCVCSSASACSNPAFRMLYVFYLLGIRVVWNLWHVLRPVRHIRINRLGKSLTEYDRLPDETTFHPTCKSGSCAERAVRVCWWVDCSFNAPLAVVNCVVLPVQIVGRHSERESPSGLSLYVFPIIILLLFPYTYMFSKTSCISFNPDNSICTRSNPIVRSPSL